MEQPGAHILVVDDEPEICTMIRTMLEREGWAVETAPDGRVALGRLEEGNFDVMILDLKMPRMGGIEVLLEIQKRKIRTDILVLTGHGSVPTAVQAMRQGAKDFLCKPFLRDDLVRSVQKLIAQRASGAPDLAGRLDAFLEASAFEPGLTLDEMARQFRISSRHATDLLKARSGMSFKKRLTYYRIREAKRLLRSGNAPLYEIAGRCGFKDYRQLTAAFQKLERMSPKEFRRRHSGE